MTTSLPAKTSHPFALIVLFALTVFTSATLMFVLQPLFGKILLPLLGGSPAVWNTCMVFYQSVLFLGYLYAHTLSTRLKPLGQISLHMAVTVLSLLALPLALPDNIAPPTTGNPAFWLFGTLLLAIGLPFFVVSTTAPLIQKWFAQIGHQASRDPYFLYAASNTGSLLALLGYPFFIEPNIGVNQQKTLWAIGYVALLGLIAVCALVFKRSQPVTETTASLTDTPAPTFGRELHWLALAFVPSSLLLGLTNFISTDIASVPLLWVIPLTVYLLSFIFVFSGWNERLQPWMLKLQALFLVPFTIYAFINPADLPYWVYLLLHVLAFFFAVMVCHGELARLRPDTRYLTRYYLLMSFAGMLGGLFNTFIAPFIFNGIYEYPLMIVAALLLRPGLIFSLKAQGWQWLAPLALMLAGLALHTFSSHLLDYFDILAIGLMLIALLTFFLRHQPLAYAGFTGALIFLSMGLHGLSATTLFQERSFFGVMSVRSSELTNEQQQPERYHELFHGTTKHGAQRLPADLQRIPLTYYSQPGPMGQLFSEFSGVNQHWMIGSVGLGAGALACYAKPEQHWTFYEIDPLVVDIARNPRYFTYLSLCAPQANMMVGDARLSLAKEPDGHFDLLILDAFSSDSVPTHLLTQEAMELYFRKLKPNGLLAFHITNRHLSIKKVISIHAEHLHLAALLQEFKPVKEIPLVTDTDWVVLAKQPKTLQLLSDSRLGNWQKMPLYFDMPPWTDDFTNIVGIWK